MPTVAAKNAKLVLYADDTSLIITNPTPMEFANKINIVFANVNEWFRNNLLSPNFNKTTCLQFRTKNSQKLDLSITFLFFSVFHPKVFDTYILNINVQSNTTFIWYVIY